MSELRHDSMRLPPPTEPPAAVTRLSCGPDFVVAAGLCGRLRAWQAPPPPPPASPPAAPRLRLSLTPAAGTELAARRAVCISLEWSAAAATTAAPAAAATDWKLVLDESSRYELANQRFTSYPYRFITAVAPDGRFVTATSDPAAPLQVRIRCAATTCTRRLIERSPHLAVSALTSAPAPAPTAFVGENETSPSHTGVGLFKVEVCAGGAPGLGGLMTITNY